MPLKKIELKDVSAGMMITTAWEWGDGSLESVSGPLITVNRDGDGRWIEVVGWSVPSELKEKYAFSISAEELEEAGQVLAAYVEEEDDEDA